MNILSYCKIIIPACCITIVISSCSTTNNSFEPWPLQSGTENLRKYYAGPELPLEQLAVLHIRRPYCIEHNEHQYRKSLLLKPELYRIPICLYGFNDFGASIKSDNAVIIELDAEPGHIYRCYHVDYWELKEYADYPNVWLPVIVDITNDETLKRDAINSPFPTIRKELVRIMKDKETVSYIHQIDDTQEVKEVAAKRLTSINKLNDYIDKNPSSDQLCSIISSSNDLQFIIEVVISDIGNTEVECARNRLDQIATKKSKKSLYREAKKQVAWLKHIGRW